MPAKAEKMNAGWSTVPNISTESDIAAEGPRGDISVAERNVWRRLQPGFPDFSEVLALPPATALWRSPHGCALRRQRRKGTTVGVVKPISRASRGMIYSLHKCDYKKQCVFVCLFTFSWDPRGLLLLYRGCLLPCFLVFPVAQLRCEVCCCLIDWLCVCHALLQTARPTPLGGMPCLRRQLCTKGSRLWQPALTSWQSSAG